MAHRLLMGWRHKCQSELGAQAQGLVHPQALGIDRNRHQIGAAGDQAVARTDGTGVFKPHVLARVEQSRADQGKGLLRPAYDENLFGIAGDAPVDAQVRGQRPAQLVQAIWVAIAQDVVTGAAQVLGRKARPLRHRKDVKCRQRRGEGAGNMRQPFAVSKAAHRLRHHARQLRRSARQRRSIGLRRLGSVYVEPGADKRAGAGARLQQALGRQAVKDLDHGVTRDTQVARQGAAGGKAFTGQKAARQDHFSQRNKQLGADRLLGVAVDLDRQKQRAACALDHQDVG